MPDDTDTFLSFPGVQHLGLIRQRLWHSGEFGRAAVMIGAGFSRNAEPHSNTAHAFPLWRDLAAALGEQLGLSGEQALATPMTRLGSEFETSFGRQALDDLLNEQIPWQHHIPGKIHRLLLDLPWADIFTTNYDTLLEDTRADIIDRKYDLVVSPSDIPSRGRPRIVKLHGSFPSHRPFIFTEEDFRRYPQDAPTFVNLVQQSMLENSLLLLGFSGDDFNFQTWAGWVRDRLGKGAPTIYLCGLLNLSDTARRYYEDRGVRPIDLSPLFPASDWPDRDEQNSRALEWLLLSLANGRIPKPTAWPQPPKSLELPERSPGLPPLLPSVPLASWQLYVGHDATAASLFKSWRAVHEAYPGWQVCPPEKRDLLWSHSYDTLHIGFNSIKDLKAPHDLLLAHTLYARLELCLMPLFTEQADIISQVVDRYRPFPELDAQEGQLRSGAPLLLDESWQPWNDGKSISWDVLRELWTDLVFGLMREARNDQFSDQFDRWRDLLAPVVIRQPAWSARWHCEQALFALGRFDIENTHHHLAAWPETFSTPYWETRRAAILVEVGALQEAERVAAGALAGIRMHLGAAKDDFELLSQEGWTLHLLDSVRFARRDWKDQVTWPKSDRLDALAALGCDVLDTLDGTAQRALASKWEPPYTQEVTKDFDPGRETRRSRSNNDSAGGLLHAFGLLRTMEEGAVPVRCGIVTNRDEGVMKAVEVLFPFAPMLAVGALIRQNGPKTDGVIERLFSRVAVVRLRQSSIDALYEILSTSVKKAERSISYSFGEIRSYDTSLANSQLTSAVEILSRISMRFNSAQLHKVLDLAIDLYRSKIFRSDRTLYNGLTHLFSRVLTAMSPIERLGRVDDLLYLPLWEEKELKTLDKYFMGEWPEPLAPSSIWNELRLAKENRPKSWVQRIRDLILLVREGAPPLRRLASLRLSGLYYMGALTESECKRFGAALWEKCGVDGFPSGTGMHAFSALLLPSPEAFDVMQIARAYFLRGEVPLVITSAAEGLSMSMQMQSQPSEYLRNLWYASAKLGEPSENELIVWSSEEANQMFSHMLNWWNNQKQFLLNDTDAEIKEAIKVQMQLMLRIIGVILLPCIQIKTGDFLDNLNRFIQETRDAQISSAEAISLLYMQSNNFHEAEQWFWEEMISNDASRVSSAVSATIRWKLITRDDVTFPGESLLEHIVDRAIFRILPGLDSVLVSLKYLLERKPDALSDGKMRRLLSGIVLLEKETNLEHREDGDLLNSIVSEDYKPNIRAKASKLAELLYHDPKYNQELSNWQEIGLKDPLPEVRLPWWMNNLSE